MKMMIYLQVLGTEIFLARKDEVRNQALLFLGFHHDYFHALVLILGMLFSS